MGQGARAGCARPGRELAPRPASRAARGDLGRRRTWPPRSPRRFRASTSTTRSIAAGDRSGPSARTTTAADGFGRQRASPQRSEAPRPAPSPGSERSEQRTRRRERRARRAPPARSSDGPGRARPRGAPPASASRSAWTRRRRGRLRRARKPRSPSAPLISCS